MEEFDHLGCAALIARPIPPPSPGIFAKSTCLGKLQRPDGATTVMEPGFQAPEAILAMSLLDPIPTEHLKVV